jgi:phosphotransferase system enzyme I (PtsI)
MISSIEELIRARDLIEKSKEELSGMGLTFDETLPVGVMIEVPSAALIASSLAEYSDFFSIGTNDLTQYTLAVDRGNERVAHLYDALHPSVLSLIQMTAAAGRERGIPVSVCGEMATSPLAIPLLVGLGIGELSGTPSAVPIVKEIVRSLRYADLQKDAAEAVKLGTVQEVHQLCSERLRSSGLLQHAEIGPWLARTVEKS